MDCHISVVCIEGENTNRNENDQEGLKLQQLQS